MGRDEMASKPKPTAPLRKIVDRPAQLVEVLECGHRISRPLGLGENAMLPSKVARRRCHLCASLPSAA